MDILVLEGDGIGPEIASATTRVLETVDKIFALDLTFTRLPIGLTALKASGTTFPPQTLQAARHAAGTILGPVSHNDYPSLAEGGVNPSGALRKGLDLYANIRPARTRAGFASPHRKPVDLVIVRENTEGFYSDRSMFVGPGEFMPTPDIALSVRKITRLGSLRIVEAAFALARRTGRSKITAVHKANVLRISDGLFLECSRQVAAKYPELKYEEKIVDAVAALLVRDPSQFDVIVTTNMFGDILSDQAAELSGSLGLAASLNVGEEHALAQAQHGSAPDIAGKDVANPSSLIGSAAMLLDWLGQRHHAPQFAKAAAAIEQALNETIASPMTRTRDMGGLLGTGAFTDAMIARLSR